MDLATAASFFDTTSVANGVTGAPLFDAQLDLYDDNRRDGLTAGRRILSFAPGLDSLIPSHRLLTLAGEDWVAGDQHPDSFQGDIVRQKLVLQIANVQVSYGSAFAFLEPATTAPTVTKGGALWTKDARLETQSDAVRSVYTLFVGRHTTVPEGAFVLMDGTYYRVRSSYLAESGFQAVEMAELYDVGLTTLSYVAKTFNGASGSYAAGAPVTVPVIVMREREQYRYLTPAAERLKHGDVQLRVARVKLPTVATGHQVVIDSVTYTVTSITPQTDATWLLTVTP